MTHDELRALAGTYALGALDGEELEAFRSHLPECWECRQRVLEYEEIYAEGATALAPVEPSPRVKESLLARIAEGAGPAEEPAPAAPATLPEGRPLAWLAFAAAAAAAGILAWLYVDASADRERLREALAAGPAAADAGEALTLLADPEAQVTTLRGGDEAPAAVARVVWRGRDVVFAGSGLPRLEADATYQLWAIAGEAKHPAGTFRAGADGRAQGAAQLAAPPEVVDAFAVTREPAGGSPQPTGPVLLLGP